MTAFDNKCSLYPTPKVKHPTEQSAEREARRVTKINKRRLRHFYHPACGFWHIGDRKKYEKKEKAKVVQRAAAKAAGAGE